MAVLPGGEGCPSWRRGLSFLEERAVLPGGEGGCRTHHIRGALGCRTHHIRGD